MERKNKKILMQVGGGFLGGIILGAVGFYKMSIYGANQGCFKAIDSIFNSAGYESCGPFGLYVGFIVGAILGVIIVNKIIKKN